ncbi:uncharacterized protein LOC135925246 isoform X2 [Gordionus sp. m RMFG-2023]|uniref:uncharacterized protein LOC135925246 isoform X2 n=1 Tax=Gordionus sp. m RMFG-2023 TaxID=3053472 RepID=UPI0031FCBCA4
MNETIALNEFRGNTWDEYFENLDKSQNFVTPNVNTHISKFKFKDLIYYGHFSPCWNQNFNLVICDICSKVLLPQAFSRHFRKRHSDILPNDGLLEDHTVKFTTSTKSTSFCSPSVKLKIPICSNYDNNNVINVPNLKYSRTVRQNIKSLRDKLIISRFLHPSASNISIINSSPLPSVHTNQQQFSLPKISYNLRNANNDYLNYFKDDSNDLPAFYTKKHLEPNLDEHNITILGGAPFSTSLNNNISKQPSLKLVFRKVVRKNDDPLDTNNLSDNQSNCQSSKYNSHISNGNNSIGNIDYVQSYEVVPNLSSKNSPPNFGKCHEIKCEDEEMPLALLLEMSHYSNIYIDRIEFESEEERNNIRKIRDLNRTRLKLEERISRLERELVRYDELMHCSESIDIQNEHFIDILKPLTKICDQEFNGNNIDDRVRSFSTESAYVDIDISNSNQSPYYVSAIIDSEPNAIKLGDIFLTNKKKRAEKDKKMRRKKKKHKMEDFECPDNASNETQSIPFTKELSNHTIIPSFITSAHENPNIHFSETYYPSSSDSILTIYTDTPKIIYSQSVPANLHDLILLNSSLFCQNMTILNGYDTASSNIDYYPHSSTLQNEDNIPTSQIEFSLSDSCHAETIIRSLNIIEKNCRNMEEKKDPSNNYHLPNKSFYSPVKNNIPLSRSSNLLPINESIQYPTTLLASVMHFNSNFIPQPQMGNNNFYTANSADLFSISHSGPFCQKLPTFLHTDTPHHSFSFQSSYSGFPSGSSQNYNNDISEPGHNLNNLIDKKSLPHFYPHLYNPIIEISPKKTLCYPPYPLATTTNLKLTNSDLISPLDPLKQNTIHYHYSQLLRDRVSNESPLFQKIRELNTLAPINLIAKSFDKSENILHNTQNNTYYPKNGYVSLNPYNS